MLSSALDHCGRRAMVAWATPTERITPKQGVLTSISGSPPRTLNSKRMRAPATNALTSAWAKWLQITRRERKKVWEMDGHIPAWAQRRSTAEGAHLHASSILGPSNETIRNELVGF